MGLLQGSFPPFNKKQVSWGSTGLTAARVDALYCTGEQVERPAVYSGPKYTVLVLYHSRCHEGAIDVLYSKQVCIDVPHYAAAWYWY
jgi:hypothetical protein